MPIHEDTAAMLYVYGGGLDDDSEENYCPLEHHIAIPIKQHIIDKFGERLQHFGVDVRTGFPASERVKRKGVNPLSHVDSKVLEPMIKVTKQMDENRRQKQQQRDYELQLSETIQRQHEEMREMREWFTSSYYKRPTSCPSR